ncbi:hypothetical protein ACRAWB_01865 [Leifsonia poae]|uniref:hypothetical protein n=1 Tax=Leifsonia poae TaxID=110933 RepID=UPI003D692690
MSDEEDRMRVGREALAVMMRAIRSLVEDPDGLHIEELNTWPDGFPDAGEVRRAMLQLLVQDYAELLLLLAGQSNAVAFLDDKLGKLEAIGLEKDVFGHDPESDGWLDA